MGKRNMASLVIKPIRVALVASLFASFALAAPAWAGDVLQQVISSGTLRVAVMGSLPPYTNMMPSGELEGYDIDIAKRLAAALGVKPQFVVVDSAGRVAALQTHKADITASGFARNVTRSLTIAFSDPYLIVPGRVVVKVDSSLKTIAEVDDPKYRMSLNRGGNSEPIIAAKFPNAVRNLYNTNADCLNALLSGQVDAMAEDAFYDTQEIAKHPGQLRMLDGEYSRQENSIGMPAGDADWVRVVNLWVEQFNASGDNKALFKKWFGFDPPRIQADF
jgi:polar amino acid transport system substrate-binding protein